MNALKKIVKKYEGVPTKILTSQLRIILGSWYQIIAKALHFYQMVHNAYFLTFPLININQNIRNKRQLWTK